MLGVSNLQSSGLKGIKDPGDTHRIYKSGPATTARVASYLAERDIRTCMVFPTSRDLAQARNYLRIFAPEEEAPFWERKWLFLRQVPGDKNFSWGDVWSFLFALHFGNKWKGFAVPLGCFLPFLPTKKEVGANHLYLRPGEEMDPEMLLETLVNWGYSRVSMVGEQGEVAVRGDILDIFAPGFGLPLRLEFFGDSLESMRMFEPTSQRSSSALEQAVLLPVTPAVAGEAYFQQARRKWEHLWTTGRLPKSKRDELKAMLADHELDVPPGLYFPESCSLLKHIGRDVRFLLVDGANMRSRLEEESWAGQEWAETKGLPHEEIFASVNNVLDGLNRPGRIIFDNLVIGEKAAGRELAEKPIREFSDYFWKPQEQKRPWPALLELLRNRRAYARQVILVFRSEKSRSKFLRLVEPENLALKYKWDPASAGIFVLIGDLRDGAELKWDQILILGEDVLQPGQKRESRVAGSDFQGLTSFDEIQENDLLVHRDYGLARFGGLHRVQAGDVSNDYILLFFAGEDRLYLPVDRLNLVQKYKGPEGKEPGLDKLGGTRWEKTKSRVRREVQKIARDLVDMYAYRKVAKGFSYSAPQDMLSEFEASFGFDETPDQERAIQEVLSDMDSPQPMDRLVCGDVGFGKTEVAMRAAFKAVADGKQVALLCPTTVLAEQHYQNFRRRMQDFAMNVSMLSRFVPKKRQETIVRALNQGKVDVLIGTHRILSQDIEIPNLSLLILDEEQRFGVRHKEKIKKLRRNIDVLTLTATPIPRTLQLSMSGIRTLSVINTPPVDRKPVQTSLLERDDEFLRSALIREMERGGQVFWVYNRVQGLNRVAEYVRKLVPEARVSAAHGQLPERELEEVMHRFWHGEIDVLVCTSIIESGLDFPRANTLIVDQAHMFGLGQLYQLRGRVGRSGEQAYAYFIVPSRAGLSEIARKRMQIILEMDYLGAGFQVAMEDLRLRGAGNILGESQSGNIGRVGLEMFLEMLDEEVHRIRGDEPEQAKEPEMNVRFAAYIPEDYITDNRERLRYYKSLSASRDEDGLDSLAAEIEDRFGELPQELKVFLQVLRLKMVLARLGVVRADLFENRLRLTWDENSCPLSPETIVAWIADKDGIASLMPPAGLEIRPLKTDVLETLRFGTDKLRGLLSRHESEGAQGNTEVSA